MNIDADKAFINKLMTHILEGTRIPKVQIERVIGPILGFFIDRVLSATLGQKIITLCPEFPIRKDNKNQSTNIDWLLYNKTRNELILLELKTCDTSFRPCQNDIYEYHQNKISSQSAGYLIKDIEKIKAKSQEYGKYDFVLKKLRITLPAYEQIFQSCSAAQIIYLIPESSKIKLAASFNDQTLILSFKDLSDNISHRFAEHWKTIRNRLIQLDGDTRGKRNNQPETSDRDNYQARLNYNEIIDQCQKHGDKILVGFEGGVGALKSAQMSSLENRKYKWDFVEGGKGTKDARNWIKGNAFLQNRPDL